MKRLFFLILVFPITLTYSNVWALNGTQLIAFSAMHEGIAGGGTALPLDYSSMVNNPAGLTELPQSASFNQFLAFPVNQSNTSATPIGNPSLGNQFSNDDNVYLPGGGFIVKTPWLRSRVTLGMSILATSGFAVDYESPRLNPALLSGDQNYDTHTLYGVFKILPTIAFEVNDQFSIGVTLHINRTQLETDFSTGAAGGFVQTAGRSRLDFSWGVGAGIGVLYKPSEKLSFGVNYVSEQYIEDYERYKDILPIGMNLPQQLNTGMALSLKKNLIVTGDFKWINWEGSKGGTGASLGEGGFGWQDQYIGILGIQWGVAENLILSAGFNHGRSSIPEESLFTNILAPTISENHLAFGVGYFVNTWMRLDASYSHTFKNTVTDNATTTGGAFASLAVDQVQVEATINF